MQFSYSVNQYDKDGDCFDWCVLGYFNNNTILRFENLTEMRLLVEKMTAVVKEIKENYPEA